MSNKSQATREKLCEAAIEIAARDGLSSMTLDNVARHAGVSKGGVTYHFPSKEKLVEGVVEHFGQRLERLVLERVAHDPQPRHRWARAMLDCTFDETLDQPKSGATAQLSSSPPTRLGVRPPSWPDRTLDPLVIERFFLAILAAATTHPGVIAPLREVGHRVRERLLADPRDGFEQLLLWLALDGLLLWQFAGLIDRNDPLFAQVGRELRARVDASEPSAKAVTNSPRSSSRRRAGQRSQVSTGGRTTASPKSPSRRPAPNPTAPQRVTARSITPATSTDKAVADRSGQSGASTAPAVPVASSRTGTARSSRSSSSPARASRRRKRSS